MANGQGIEVIQFRDSTGTVIKTFAAPFKIREGDNIVFTVNGSEITIDATSSGFVNPMTALGDLIAGGSSGTPTRIAIGPAHTVLHSDGATPEWVKVDEDDLALTDTTVNNTSTGSHGFAPKLPGVAAQFLNGDGNWVIPAGQASGYTSQGFSNVTSVTVTHNFGAYPAVQIQDTSGYLLVAKNVQHISLNTFVVTFDTSSSGVIIATLGSPQAQSVVTVTNNYTVQLTDRIITASAAGITITLPTPIGHIGFEYAIDNHSSGIIHVVSAVGTIEGEVIQNMPQDSGMHIFSDGSTWRLY